MDLHIEYCETGCRLELFVKSGIFDRKSAKDIYDQSGAIRRILISSINTSKAN